ncbi:hypothetical protein J2S20_001562 [Moryella indoligenes]|uniref:Uncharacterized protein n=1 Tax=Moryella indoligenes TaxID=371674 RepID=A0AAE4AM85_9FIRM|nr:hypothetical protein [Moryella indoligenes]MDQ0152861.1 hypothetical protein [Moryella indoligenes]
MEKIYRRSLVAFIYNLIIMIFGVLVAFLISGVIGGYKVAIIISSIIIILVVISIFRQLRTKIIINGNGLLINDGKKEFNYNLNEVHISSEQRNNDSFFLYLYTEDGNKEMFDLSSLGKRKYNELIEDLGVVGVKSKTIKLNDVNKNN